MSKKTQIKKVTPFAIFCWIGFAAIFFFIAFYAYWMIVTSLKNQSIFDLIGGNVLGLPESLVFGNYGDAWLTFNVKLAGVESHLWQMLIYSFGFSLIASLSTTLSCMLVGYATGRFNVFFNKIIYGFVLVAMTLPVIGTTPSLIAIMYNLGLYNTWPGIFVSRFYFTTMYYMIFHEMFRAIPKTYSEAAKIDGANNFYIMLRIMFPLVKVTFVTIFVLLFVSNWNDYSTPLLILKSYPNIALGLYIFRTKNGGDVPLQMAACVLTMIPVIIFFLIFRKQLVGNVSMGGLKE